MNGTLQKLFIIWAVTLILCISGLLRPKVAFSGNCEYQGLDVVVDHTSGLTWQKGNFDGMTRAEAKSRVQRMTLQGYSDWRLPNIDQLQNLSQSQCKKYMEIKSGRYWSSEPKYYFRHGQNHDNNAFNYIYDIQVGRLYSEPCSGRKHTVKAVRITDQGSSSDHYYKYY